MRVKVNTIITMYARHRRKNGHTDRQTDEHHGNSATIRSMKALRAENGEKSHPEAWAPIEIFPGRGKGQTT